MKIQVKIIALGTIAMMVSSAHARPMLSIYNYTQYQVTGTVDFCKDTCASFKFTIPGAIPNKKTNKIGPDEATTWEKSWGHFLDYLEVTAVTKGTTLVRAENMNLAAQIAGIDAGKNPVWYEIRQDKDGRLYITCSKRVYHSQVTDANGHWIIARERKPSELELTRGYRYFEYIQ